RSERGSMIGGGGPPVLPFRVSGALRRYPPVLCVRRGLSWNLLVLIIPILSQPQAILPVLDASSRKLKAFNPNLKHEGSSITDAAGQNMARSVYYDVSVTEHEPCHYVYIDKWLVDRHN
ncbi:uncharacterized protein METZ01_LOCUS489125, partial [marine metagenome]